MLKMSKKSIKVVSVAIAAFFVLGVVGISLSQTGKGYAAGAGTASNVGKVNYQALISQHPDVANAEETMKTEVEQAKKDFDAKTTNMNEQQKQEYYMQLQQRLNLKQQELIAPIHDKVSAAIKAVADAKGIAVVLDTGNVVYGGQDLTDEVLKKITGK